MVQLQLTRTPKIKLSEHEMAFAETLEFAKTYPLASNRDVDIFVVNGELRQFFRTGTLIAYEAQDKKFGKEVEFEGVTFIVPPEFQGIKNCALVIEQPNYTFENGTIKVQNVELVADFPLQNGWYLTHATGVPQGKHVNNSNKNARFLWRVNTPYIGSVSRNGIGSDLGRDANADWTASNRLKVAQVDISYALEQGRAALARLKRTMLDRRP